MTARSVAPGPPPGLPVPPTPLVGRAREVSEVAGLIAGGAARLVTLTGPGGVGKTRLAIAVAADLAGRFAGSVRFVGLAAITDPGLVPAAVAQSLGIRESGDEPLLDRIASALGSERVLLVLDNMEQVVVAATMVSDLLAACPGLAVLATSRVRLRVSGEVEVETVPLAVVGSDEAVVPDAARLFADRARAVRSDFAVNADNAATVVAICRRLDGIPLAIELAAARIKVLPPAALLSRLDHPLALLTGGARDLPARQQTVRATVAWSCDLLSAEEQSVFRRLAVFVGGFTLDAAHAVVGDAGIDVLDGVAALVDHSLLRRTEGPAGDARFVMLETVREFGLEQLQISGEADVVRDRHAAWFLAATTRLADVAEWSWRPDELDRIDADLPNIRAALDRFAETGAAEAAQRLAGGLGPFWWMRSRLGDARERLDKALAVGPPAGRSGAAALVWTGSFRWATGDTAGGEGALVLAKRLAAGAGEFQLVASACLMHGLMAEFALDDETAVARYQEGLVAARAAADPGTSIALLGNLGDAMYRRGDVARAEALCREAMTYADDPRIGWMTNNALPGLAWAVLTRGDLDEAATLWGEALETALAFRDPWFFGNALAGFAGVAFAAGNPARAARLLGAAETQRIVAGRATLPYRFQAERLEAAVRDALGPAAFGSAYAEGRAMSSAASAAAARERPSLVGTKRRRSGEAAFGLSSRETEVLALLAGGRSNTEIAEALFISRRTVTTHLTRVFAKLGVASRAEAVAFAHREGLR